jgi:hypothetical protein
VCEERLGHEHPFIKILRPEDAPKFILTAINEDEEAKKIMEEKAEQAKQAD